MRVTVLDDWPGVARDCADWSALEARAEVVFEHAALRGEALVRALEGSDVVLPMRERTWFDADLLRALPRLKLIALTGATVRHIDVPAVRGQGITLCWSGVYVPEETAEFTLGLILAAERGIADGVAAMRAGGFMEGTGLGRRMAGRTMGILGLGNIGGRLARMAAAMEMRVIAWSRSLTPEAAAAVGAEAVSFDRVFTEADVLSVQVLLRPETVGLVGRREIELMKPRALMVNTARGPVVDEAAMVAALRDGRIRAALDVYDAEPLPADHPLRGLPGVTMTPHLGYNTRECMEMFYGECVENILAWMDGAPIRVLD